LIVLAAALVVAQAVEKEELLRPRLLSSAMRIGRLECEIKGLKHEIEEAGKIDPLGFVLEMHARLDQVEGESAEKFLVSRKSTGIKLRDKLIKISSCRLSVIFMFRFR